MIKFSIKLHDLFMVFKHVMMKVKLKAKAIQSSYSIWSRCRTAAEEDQKNPKEKNLKIHVKGENQEKVIDK